MRAVPEVARVLCDGGGFAAVWTGPDAEVGWVRELRAGEASGPGDGGSAVDRGPRHRVVELPVGSPFVDVKTTEVTGVRRVAREDVLGLLGTYSSSIRASDEARARARARAGAVLDARQGGEWVELPVRAHCWRATRSAGRSAS